MSNYPSRKNPALRSYILKQKSKHNLLRYRKTPLPRAMTPEKKPRTQTEISDRPSTPLLNLTTAESSCSPSPQLLLSSFIREAQKIQRLRPNYKKCLIQSIEELRSIKKSNTRNLADIVASKPYARKNSKKFFLEVKEDNISKVESMLLEDPGLVFVFDNLKMTALHWAALRNYHLMASLLVKYGSSINTIDARHRTPLFIASKFNHLEVVEVLVNHNADIMRPGPKNALPVSSTSSLLVRNLLSRTAKLIENQN